MINDLKNTFSKLDNRDLFFFLIVATFPLSLIFGNLIINLSFILFAISFFINFDKNKIYLNNKAIYLLIFFFVTLLINVFFSQSPINSFPRVLKILFIILFTVEASRILNEYDLNKINIIFKVWLTIFCIVLIDCFFEIIFGFNTLGFYSELPGRISSFFGGELVVGAFIYGFSLFSISYLIIQKKNNYILLFFIFSIIIISFLIGERSNFIRLFISILIFSMLAIKVNFFYKIITFFSIIGLFVGFLNFNSEYKYRYYTQIKSLYSKNGVDNFLKNSQYGAHQTAAIKIFYEYPFFGVGIKNFRHESNKKKYEEDNASHIRQATHPHQLHLEFLSETGFFGYLSFLIFILSSLIIAIQNFFKEKNLYQLSGIIFIITSLLPILPSGSFLSTFSSGIFWLNFAVMIGFCKFLKNKS